MRTHHCNFNRFLLTLALLWLCVCLGRAVTAQSETQNESGNGDSPNVTTTQSARIPCRGLIDDGLFESIKRRTTEAVENGATYLFYEIDTYGGLVKSADDISKYLILKVPSLYPDVHTVAYVSTQAISAGAMISVSCQDIIMRENTTIGDSAPIVMGGKLEGVEREKQESFIRAIFERAAEANNYPEPLLKAMVSQGIAVYRVKNLETGEFEFFEAENLPEGSQKYALDEKELIISDERILTLTASDAEKYGVARAVVDDFQGALDFIAERDGIKFTGDTIIYKPNWSEQMVRMLNSPAVASILVMLALLGAYIELNTPGLGLPGLVAVICVVTLVGSKYLIGMANWVEVAILVLGLILLAVEIFIIPGFGVAGIAGIICIALGIFGMLIRNAPDEIPWPQTEFDWDLFIQGMLSMLVGFIAFIAGAIAVGRFLPKIQFLSGLILSPASTSDFATAEISATPEVAASDFQKVHVGDTGVVTSPLRPCGSARFGDVVVDVVAQAQFLPSSTPVEIVEIHGNRIVVKKCSQQQED
ncbi:hypothetical protein STSP2_02341 [Anaerohalosphaera lusitana]|uniref:Uncharacterized protein n=1 Tax=Anaerohalosphaera lusitana TaxID=1936003 RepID=A0A1U9NN37_9BACT|nr:NfeD family protein [Anaerohalosphaera lusitana]AQT69154.1 hypothetical protein STSP2_02341 [Anaerohalosphaera lusitana]